jgi:nitroimidazol reductase NimA-like FMN-containing flavoprotein (pyridoxamine 5'-phosphate oxidase superfamily)
MLRSTTDQEARALLSKSSVGRLGCVVAGEPYVVPINYYFDGRAIYSHSLPGRKIDALRLNPRACMQVDKIDDQLHWQSAIAFGRFEEIIDGFERAEVMRELLNRFPMLTVVESKVANQGNSPDPLVFRIQVVFPKFRTRT